MALRGLLTLAYAVVVGAYDRKYIQARYFLAPVGQSCSEACPAKITGSVCDAAAIALAAASVQTCKVFVEALGKAPQKGGRYDDDNSGCTYDAGQTGWYQVMWKDGPPGCDVINHGTSRQRVCACKDQANDGEIVVSSMASGRHAMVAGPLLAVGLAVGAMAIIGGVWLGCRRASQEMSLEPEFSAREPFNPAWAAVTLEQLGELRDLAQTRLGDDYPNATMYDINVAILQPMCDEHQKCYAHIVNERHLKHIDAFVSHAWAENFDDFVNHVQLPFRTWRLKPNVWVCALAIRQSACQELLANQISADDPSQAPFTKALSEASTILVVRNSTVDVYERIWCCWELYLAHGLGLAEKQGGLMVTGPQQPVESHPVDILKANCSDTGDKACILKAMKIDSASQRCADVNQLLNEVRLQTN